MNIMGLIFSILFMLSFGFYAWIEKGATIRPVHRTFIGQLNVSRKVLEAYEQEAYKKMRGSQKLKKKKDPKPESICREIPAPPKINPLCARLNLWPLLQNGREEHQILYEQLAHLLRTFYKKPLFPFFKNPSRLEYRFLDLWLEKLKLAMTEKPEGPLLLEKIDLKDPQLQMLYYNMLRGAEEQYPSLLDFVKAAQPLAKEEKLCLLHATPKLLSLFFDDAAQAVYEELHGDKIVVTEEMIEEICRRHRYTLFNKELFTILTLSKSKHDPSLEMTLLEEDPSTHISLRKKIYLPKS